MAPGTIPTGQWNATYDVLDKKGTVTTLTGRPGIPAELEDGRMLFRADQIDYDETSGDVKATGHVFFQHFEKHEQIWASRVEYNTEGEHGTPSSDDH